MEIRDQRWLAALAILVVLASACGSQLTEEQVLARSGAQPGTAGALAGAEAGVGPGASTGATTVGGAADASGGGAGTAAGTVAGPAGGVGATAAGSAEATACKTKESGPILVASVGNYSGAGGSSQDNFPKAVQLWASMINGRGGLCGRQVQVFVADDGGDPARYGTLVRDMVENRNVVAFVGNGAVLSYQGGIEYHNKSGVPVFGNDCSVDPWFNSPVLAPTCPIFFDMVTGYVRAAVDVARKKNFGFVYCSEAQACQDGARMLRDKGAVRRAGAKLVYSKSVSISQVDFTAECQAARDAGAELFNVGADSATTDRMATSCARQNYFPQYVAIALTLGKDNIRTRGLENIIIGVPTFPFAAATGGAIDEYNDALRTLGPDIKPSPSLSMGWTGAKLFELVATRAAKAGGSITPKALVTALHTVRNETLGGLTIPLTFDAKGAHPPPCYFVMQGDGKGKGYVLPFGSKPRCL